MPREALYDAATNALGLLLLATLFFDAGVIVLFFYIIGG